MAAAPQPWHQRYARLLRAIPIVVAIGWLLFDLFRIVKGIKGTDIANHIEFGRRLLTGSDLYGAGGLNHVYPPFWAVPFALLSLLPVPVGKAVVFVIGLAALAMLVAWLSRLAANHFPLPQHRGYWAIVLAVFLASPFLARDLSDCLINTTLVALTWLAIVLWRRGRDVTAGLCLGLVIALKCTPAIFAMYFLWKRQWRIAAAAAVFSVLFTLSPILFQGPSAYGSHMHRWLDRVWTGLREPDPSMGTLEMHVPDRGIVREERVDNLALKPALARYLMNLPYPHLGRPETNHDPADPPLPPDPRYLQFLNLSPRAAGIVVKVIIVGLVSAIAWWTRRRATARNDPRLLWELAAVGVLMLLLSPITWKQHAVAVLPGMVLICYAGLSRRLPKPATVLVGLYAVCVLLLNRGLLGWRIAELLDSYHVKTLGLLALLGALVYASYADGSSGPLARKSV